VTDTPLFDRPFILSMGPQRAGTSWLDRYLRERGDICMPHDVKEIFFFDRNYDRGDAFYTSHFHPQPQHRAIMEVSTTSFDEKDAPANVFKTFGEHVTLLCPLRHPVARSYSLYLHYKRYGMTSATLQQACRDIPQILESSHYTRHLKQWMTYYPLEKMHIIFQEDLEDNCDEYVDQVCRILDLPPMPISAEVKGRYNQTTRAPIPALAKMAQKGADFLRRHKLYGPINAAKAIGLKQVIFGRGGEGGRDDLDQVRNEDIAWLHGQLSDEIGKLETLLGRRIDQWHADIADHSKMTG